jgi:uncharacterized protein YbjT (DUF2867 family)
MAHHVFVTGGTGYLGLPLMAALTNNGHRVRALVRPGSESKLSTAAQPVVGNVLDASTWAAFVRPADTIIHLVGTPHPSPAKAAEFRRVDLPSVRACAEAAVSAGVSHIIYVSVAHPAPIMEAYIAVRKEGEALVRATGIATTILRPWYVLGPGHRWPYALVPLYALARLVPSRRESARRLGLVSRRDMVAALVRAVEHPPSPVRIVDVPGILDAGAGIEWRSNDGMLSE